MRAEGVGLSNQASGERMVAPGEGYVANLRDGEGQCGLGIVSEGGGVATVETVKELG